MTQKIQSMARYLSDESVAYQSKPMKIADAQALSRVNFFKISQVF